MQSHNAARPDQRVVVVAPYYRLMAVLDDLAACLGEETAMKVNQAVLLLSTDDGIPRARMTGKKVRHHALFAGPAGLFFCDLHVSGSAEIFAAVAAREIEVDYFERLDATVEDAIRLEGNWPSRKVLIDDEYYALPRNFAGPLRELLDRPKDKKRRR